ncbi:MAG: hypothetical protein AABX11_04770 [Nanoarchaeota archaeon]
MENTTEQENAKQLEVIQAVKSYNPEFIRSCYAVGLWVWADFKQRLSPEELTFLKQLGFRWNPSRKVWQNACGVTRRSSAGDPRQKYQVVTFVEN